MLKFQKIECLLNPITALAFVPLKSGILLLAGEGPFLHIYNPKNLTRLASQRVFDSQYIHGVIYFIVTDGLHGDECQLLVLLWGGNLICLLRVDNVSMHDQSDFNVKRISSIIEAEDRILDASFSPKSLNRNDRERDLYHVFLVTSHNCLQYLRFHLLSSTDCIYDWRLCYLKAGPKVMLYSAHLVWSLSGRGLIAAGTILGEVFLWSFHSDIVMSDPECSAPTFLHYTFLGHEGSVFGVRISEKPTESSDIPSGRVLASCGDDRTIRIWDISLLDEEFASADFDQREEKNSLPHHSREISSNSIATTMGHASRIWGVRFLQHTRERSLLLSFGEDATSQIWHFRTPPIAVSSEKIGEATNDCLQHLCLFEYHAKRNVWSAATHIGIEGGFTVITGGADGRIVSFNIIDDEGSLRTENFRSTAWTMSGVLDELHCDDKPSIFEDTGAAKSDSDNLPGNVFKAFEGNWKVSRRLESGMSTYLSGNFQGTASFEMRSPTDPAYDAEYLYLEKGQFSSEQGLIMSATRRYVYRFQRSNNTISAWFVKAEDGSSVDYLFHHVNFTSWSQETLLQTDKKRKCLLEADGQHMCIDDDYRANYLFQFQDTKCDGWELKYSVKGPRKAYTANARYIRDDSQKSIQKKVEADDAAKKNLDSMEMRGSDGRKVISGVGSFSSYVWAGDDQLFVSTTQGHLLGEFSHLMSSQHGKATNQINPGVTWQKFGQSVDLGSVCLATSIQNPAIAVFAGKEGILYFYQHPKQLIKSQIQIPAKATYLKAHLIVRCGSETHNQKAGKITMGIIASCLESSSTYIFYVDVDQETSLYAVTSSLMLTLLPNFIVKSSCFTVSKDLLILGSRHGALAIYEPLANSVDRLNIVPSLVLQDIHGKDAITTIENLPVADSKCDAGIYILTTGKDGMYSIHLITTAVPRNRDTPLGLQTMHTCKPPFGPNIEGGYFNRTTEELWLWGFKGRDFVGWNESRQARMMTIECGGAHRNWAFSPGNTKDFGGHLVWTKASSCRVSSQPNASHQILQSGGHGREIKAAAISPPIQLLCGSMARYIATGAEDTIIRIFRVSRLSRETRQTPSQGLRCVGLLNKHACGLQQLRWSSNGQLLFSAAGCEEFFVWRVRPTPCVEIGVLCDAVCPLGTESADLRIMGFDVMEMEKQIVDGSIVDRYLLSMVYSDSTVRIYSYESASNKSNFHLVSEGTYTTYCLTQAVYLHFETSIQLCTASTDGHVSFWSLNTALAESEISTVARKPKTALSNQRNNAFPSSENPTAINWHSRTQIHQSSITAICSLSLSASSFLLATGGDDGALGFTVVTCPSSSSTISNTTTPPFSTLPEPLFCSVLLIPNAHAAAITAVTCLDFRPSDQPSANEKKEETQQEENSAKPQYIQWHSFATTGPDQKLQIWRVKIDIGIEGVASLRVEKGDRVSTAVADVACLEGFLWGSADDDGGGGGGGEFKGHEGEYDQEQKKKKKNEEDSKQKRRKLGVLVAGIGLEIWNCNV